jgi:serine/threonine protein kinase
MAAHAADVVHRDVETGNVLLDAHGRVRLGDFGPAFDLEEPR